MGLPQMPVVPGEMQAQLEAKPIHKLIVGEKENSLPTMNVCAAHRRLSHERYIYVQRICDGRSSDLLHSIGHF